MKLDHYSVEELAKLKLLSEADVIINPFESIKVKLKVNPRFDSKLQEGDDVDIEPVGQNLTIIAKSKVLPQRIVEVEFKTIYQNWTVRNGFVLGLIKAFGPFSGNGPTVPGTESDSRVNGMEAEEGELITMDEQCEICKDWSITELDGMFFHYEVNMPSQTWYKYTPG